MSDWDELEMLDMVDRARDALRSERLPLDLIETCEDIRNQLDALAAAVASRIRVSVPPVSGTTSEASPSGGDA